MKFKKEGGFAQVCKDIAKQGSQVDTVEQENFLDDDCQGKSEDVHAYFGSVELGTVSDNRKRHNSLITLKIAGREVRIKTDTGAEATVIPYNLKRKSLRNLCKRFTKLSKAGLQSNPYIKGLRISSDSVQAPKFGCVVPCCERRLHTTVGL